MLWTREKTFVEQPFESESDLEDSILEIAPVLFGENRIYLDAKRKIGARGKTQNIPDGYLIDLSSAREPRLYVVENELAVHEPLRHIAVQILQFSLSFESAPHLVKEILKTALRARPEALAKCQTYAAKHGFENIDYLLERLVIGANRFNALIIIDELDSELETVLISRFKFPVEILTLERYRGPGGETIYDFSPFLTDTTRTPDVAQAERGSSIDPAEIDTIVVPAREEGFKEVFLGENRWYKIRIHASMLQRIKHIAAYRVAPDSAITHIAPVSSIEQWPDTNKYVVNFKEPAKALGPIKLCRDGEVHALQGPRYTSRAKLERAKTLDEAF